MPTFEQNIRKIRGEAIYGKEIRTAIADAVQQAVNLDISAEGDVLVELVRIGSTNDYKLVFVQQS